MNKEKAILTLSEALVEKGIVNIVSEETIKQELLAKGEHVFVRQEGKLDFNVEASEDNWGDIKRELISWSRKLNANYIFSNLAVTEDHRRAFAMHIAIIGSEEARQLRKIFYKDVPEEIIKAKIELNIGGNIALRDENYRRKENYFFESFFEEYKKGLSTGLDLRENIMHGYLPLGYSNEKKEKDIDILFDETLDFVFSLPDKDRNLESDREILRKLEWNKPKYIVDLMKNIYSANKDKENERFKKYFSGLNPDLQNRIVEKLKLENGK